MPAQRNLPREDEHRLLALDLAGVDVAVHIGDCLLCRHLFRRLWRGRADHQQGDEIALRRPGDELHAYPAAAVLRHLRQIIDNLFA